MVYVKGLSSRGQGFDSQRAHYTLGTTYLAREISQPFIQKILEAEYACTWDMLVSRMAVTTEELSNVCRVRVTRGDGIYHDFGIVPHRADANLERVIVKATI